MFCTALHVIRNSEDYFPTSFDDYNCTTLRYNNTTLHCTTLQLQYNYATLDYNYTTTTLRYTSSSCASGDRCNHSKKHDTSHLSVHQWVRSAVHESQQPTSGIGFQFLKLLPPSCAVLLVIHSTWNWSFSAKLSDKNHPSTCHAPNPACSERSNVETPGMDTENGLSMGSIQQYQLSRCEYKS